MHSSSRGQPYNPVRQAIRALCEFAEGCSSASGQGGACLGCRFAGFFASRCGETRSSGRRFASVERDRSPISTHRSQRKKALPALALAALAALAPVAAAPSVLAAAPTALAAVVGAAAPAAAPAAALALAAPHRAEAAFVALAKALLRIAGTARDIDGLQLAVLLAGVLDVEGEPVAGLGGAAAAVLNVQEDVLPVELDEAPALHLTVGLHGALAAAAALALAATLARRGSVRVRVASAALDVSGLRFASLGVHLDVEGQRVAWVRGHAVAIAHVHEHIRAI
mmetsp:Transcript_84412/g.272880  ORF Transcript_84412/g.272880 Transcript_84412/m.272880 type:complete len:282 (-) Transcript_84412:147-992(-)